MPEAARRISPSRKLDTPAVGSNGVVGLREQKKLDKRQRIRTAARELFAKLGYEQATLRQIARRAHVGLGTLFNYADDKRDLVFLISNEDLERITERAVRATQEIRDFREQLIALFRVHYQEFAREPTLSRILLQELTFYSHGKQAAEFHTTRLRLISHVEALVRAAQEKGQVRPSEDPTLIARYIFFLYSTAVRWWIGGENPDPESGIRELRRLFELQMEGLAPRRG